MPYKNYSDLLPKARHCTVGHLLFHLTTVLPSDCFYVDVFGARR